jgi:hypothetical protein
MISDLTMRIGDRKPSRRLPPAALPVLLVIVSVLTGYLAGTLAGAGKGLAIVGLVGVLLPVLVWRWPASAVFLFVLATTVLEQQPFPASLGGIVTDHVPFFTSLSDAFGVAGILVNPLELTMGVVLLTLLFKAVANRQLWLPRSAMAKGIMVLLAIVIFAEMLGLARGGDFRVSLREIRPWLYLIILFMITFQLARTRAALRALLWAVVIGSGIKGIQGTIRFFSYLHVYPKPNEILAHEEAVFLGLFTLLVAALWIWGEPGRLRRVATGLLPFVTIANLSNNRRTSWLILLAGLAALLVMAWIRFPDRRRWLKGIMAGLATAALVYFPLFWNSAGTVGQPARAVRSTILPDQQRDFSSNLYRVQEDANLKVNIRQSAPLGAGFGIRINYVLPIVDLTKDDPFLLYIPHNTVLWAWLRLGFFGFIIFWFVIGAALISACRLLRIRDRELSLFGAFAVCALLAYLFEAYYDLGMWWFRIAVFMGCLLGTLEGARRMSHEQLELRTRGLSRG